MSSCRATNANPWAPIVEIYRLGCAPLGYVYDEGEAVFGVYVPVAS